MDSILTSFIVFIYLFTSTNSPTPSIASSTGLARAVTSFISFQAFGQANNFARLLANNVIASIFLADTKVWRLFYLYFFAMITGPIIAAILYWYITSLELFVKQCKTFRALNTARLPRLDSTQPISTQSVVTVNRH